VSSLFDSPEFNQRLFFPRRAWSPCPSDARDAFVEVDAGVRLHWRTHLAPSAPLRLVFFHGNGEVVADYDDVAGRFLALGLEVVFFDYRGYGQSTGTPSLRALYADAVKCLQQVPRDRPRIVFGRSLGAAAAAELAGREGLSDGLVLESGGSDLGSLLARRGFAPYALDDEERAVFDPRPKLARCRVPALVLHGAEDELIPPSEAQGALDALGSTDKHLVLVPDRGHNDVSFNPAYWDALGAFFVKWR
jgi:hypothetical protein